MYPEAVVNPKAFQFNHCTIKRVKAFIIFFGKPNFNSTIVRLRATIRYAIKYHIPYFNSTIVRLREIDSKNVFKKTKKFQFNHCTIKSGSVALYILNFFVFQFNHCTIKSRPFIGIELRKEQVFQFNHCTIKSRSHERIIYVHTSFQFNHCTIKSRWIVIFMQDLLNFNSTIVRLRAAIAMYSPIIRQISIQPLYD